MKIKKITHKDNSVSYLQGNVSLLKNNEQTSDQRVEVIEAKNVLEAQKDAQ